MAWLRREPDDASAGQTADRIRAAIVDLTERRDEAATATSAALLGQVEVQHALRDQHRRLQLALTQLDHALTLARRVAEDTARDEGELAALPFRGNVEGLGVQRDVVVAAIAQLDQLQDASRSHVGAARDVLGRSRAAFDLALREQLRLLVALERLERSRVLFAARAARGQERP
ncbi:hypothetical protein [uncultured Jatrophihabitans sp.]|uniref:hypothetical protein n=1 Tax=uncultured Jatrophihabitans sp. TaxID=1610747 RepID=UPI0035CC5C88